MTSFVTVWTPFVEINALCGGVRVFPETAQQRKSSQGTFNKDPTEFWYRSEDTNGYTHADPEMRPGDVLIFHRHLLHGSRANLSDTLRLSLDMRFFGAADRTRKHYLDLQRMEVYEPYAGEQHVRV